MNVFPTFLRFDTLLRGFLRENPGAKTNKKTNLKTKKAMRQYE